MIAGIKSKPEGTFLTSGSTIASAWDLPRIRMLMASGIKPSTVKYIPTQGGAAPAITELLEQYKMIDAHERSALRLNSMACVALPTCGLALAESQRYLPDLITELDSILEDAGLRHDAITIRMTGCPNGCARPYIAEIAFVGRAPGKYNVYLGGGFAGQRLSKLYRESVKAEDIKTLLAPIIARYARERNDGERFGDFCIRTGYVNATVQGQDFHQNIKPEALKA